MSESSTYSERFMDQLEALEKEFEEIKSFADDVSRQMEENNVRYGDKTLIERKGREEREPGIIGELFDIPGIIPTMNRIGSRYEGKFALNIPLKNEKYIIKNSEEEYELHFPDIPPNTLVYPKHNLEFKENAVERLDEKYGIKIEDECK